jgi:hypothetical protein
MQYRLLFAARILLPTFAALAVEPDTVGQSLMESKCVGRIWSGDPHQPISSDYCPREGDLVFMSTAAPLRTAAYIAFRTGHPLHMGMIVRHTDGTLGVLETGGGESKVTTIRPIDERFAEHVSQYRNAVLWVRRIDRPLTEEESQRLTAFAEAQVGKPLLPNARFMRLFIPGRPATPSHADQRKWFCSELVVESLREAGIIDTRLASASIVPADLFHDRRVDLSGRWSPAQEWTPEDHLPEHRPRLAPPPTMEEGS